MTVRRLSPQVWLWLAWMAFVVSFFLPSFNPDVQTIPGYRCAWYAVEAWFPSALRDALTHPGTSDSAMVLMLGWFNVTNAAALVAPLVAGQARWRPALGWVVFLCGFGSAHAVAFVAGVWTQEPLWYHLRPGFYVWAASYAALAIAGWGCWKKETLTNV